MNKKNFYRSSGNDKPLAYLWPIVSTALFILILLGLFLRVTYLQMALTGDEAYTFLAYGQGPLLTTLGKYNLPNNHILNSLLIFLTATLQKWLGAETSLWTLRLPVFVAGVAIVPLTTWTWFSLLRSDEPTRQNRISDALFVGIGAAALVAVSFRMVHYSVEARGYMLQTLLFLLSIIAIEEFFRSGQRRWIYLYGLWTALGLLAVPTHLFAATALGIWFFLRAWQRGSHALKATFKAHSHAIFWSVLFYSPAVFYSLSHGTKIEPRESRHELTQIFLSRAKELLSEWSNEHSSFTAFWVAIGLIILLVAAKHRKKQVSLVLLLLISPLLVSFITARPPPFTRVWTYLLPVLFGAAILGWHEGLRRLNELRSTRAALNPEWFLILISLPILFSAEVTRTRLPQLNNQLPNATLRFMQENLRSGHHMGFPSEFYDRVRVTALTHPNFRTFDYRPLLRETAGDITVIQRNGAEILKVDPFAGSPGIFLFALSKQDEESMEAWLKKYQPLDTTLHAKTLVSYGATREAYPKIMSYELLR